MNPNDYHLCLIIENRAFFAPVPACDVWGDDWDDAPYWCNAGAPYHDDTISVLFDGAFYLPGEDDNKHFSVQQINALIRPWLYSPDNQTWLYANATLTQFVKYVCANGGAIYTRITDADLALAALTSQE